MTLDMATLATVKAVRTLTGTGLDASIGALISQVSASAEKFMNRVALAAAQVEYHDVGEGQQVFALRAFPVTALADVRYDYDRAWGSGAIITASDYTYDPVTGLLTIDRFSMTHGKRLLQVNYTGGMAATTAAFIAAFPDLANAVASQVAFMVQHRDQYGIKGMSADGANVNIEEPSGWLEGTVRALRAERRRSGG